jgi:hypothetical protein
MREAASAMGLAAKALEHADTVMTRHITDTIASREVVSLATGDGRIIQITRNTLLGYQKRGALTPALESALTALDSADAGFRALTSDGMSTNQALGVIQDAQVMLEIARKDFRQELLDYGVPAEQTESLFNK